jgi:leucyl-tRNA synthetase
MDVTLNEPGNPLERHEGFVNTTCPKCGRASRRDTDTLEAYSSPWWYHWNCKKIHSTYPFDKAESKLYMPIDLMIGGADQIRTCFFHIRMMALALKHAGIVEYEEPVDTLLAIGFVKMNGRKMSKSEGNSLDAMELINEYGADSLRMAMMDSAAPEVDLNWSHDLIKHARKFLVRAFLFFERNTNLIDMQNEDGIDKHYSLSEKLSRHVETAARKTVQALLQNRFHLATKNLVLLLEKIESYEKEARRRRMTLDQRDVAAISSASKVFLRLLAPICPHISEELWCRHGGRGMLAEAQTWEGNLE